ncbi:MAG TPA: GDSL-type esterase/lipase family protein [Opitutus sp.]|nr:GDSL-type esterase/lipase family protein [Opitutus sp.]
MIHISRRLLWWVFIACAAPQLAVAARGSERRFVAATDLRLQFTDGLNLVRDETDGSAHFDRVIDGPARGFRWDSPGARVSWRTDSASVRVRLRYTERHIGASRNSIGVFRIDGRGDLAWTFTRPAGGEAELTVTLPVLTDGSCHDYEVILPYGDSVDVLGVEVTENAALAPARPRPGTRYIAFGDSVTHGFTATEVTKTYAFQVAERNGWELINLGIGGRGTHGPDGAFLARVNADVISLLIGVNDWQAGAELESFRANYAQLVAGLREGHPKAPVYLITPLWVSETWAPNGVRYPLESYRAVIREVAAAFADPLLAVIEGPLLIDHDPRLFDRIAVHPNDAGFAQMADRLAPAIRDSLK